MSNPIPYRIEHSDKHLVSQLNKILSYISARFVTVEKAQAAVSTTSTNTSMLPNPIPAQQAIQQPVQSGGSAESVTSIAGTAAEVAVSAPTGDVVLQTAFVPATPPYVDPFTPDLGTSKIIVLAANGNADINAPINMPAVGHEWRLRVANVTAGLITMSWAPVFMVGTGAPIPAAGFSRIYSFYWDGTSHWLMNVSATDL